MAHSILPGTLLLHEDFPGSAVVVSSHGPSQKAIIPGNWVNEAGVGRDWDEDAGAAQPQALNTVPMLFEVGAYDIEMEAIFSLAADTNQFIFRARNDSASQNFFRGRVQRDATGVSFRQHNLVGGSGANQPAFSKIFATKTDWQQVLCKCKIANGVVTFDFNAGEFVHSEPLNAPHDAARFYTRAGWDCSASVVADVTLHDYKVYAA